MDQHRALPTHHTESIVTNDLANAERLPLRRGRLSAVAAVNASTRSPPTEASSASRGRGVGISTQKLHARGPMGLPG